MGARIGPSPHHFDALTRARNPLAYFRRSAMRSMPACPQASSFSPAGEALTPIAPMVSLPDLIGTPPPSTSTSVTLFKLASAGVSARRFDNAVVGARNVSEV